MEGEVIIFNEILLSVLTNNMIWGIMEMLYDQKLWKSLFTNRSEFTKNEYELYEPGFGSILL